MRFPTVYPGDIVCITTEHNEVCDDLHYGIVESVPDTYNEDGKIDVIFIVNSNRGVQKHTFKFNPEFTGWDTWRITNRCAALNCSKRKFTHSCPPKDWNPEP